MGTIHKFTGGDKSFDWDGVALHQYPNDRAKDVCKYELIGKKEGAGQFVMRYFEVAPGGFTSLDNHKHDHGVMIVRGGGKIRLGDTKTDIGFGDVIYIEPFETHQFENENDETLGFICVIPPKK